MDSKGYWHSTEGQEEAMRLEKVMAGLNDDGVPTAARERPVIILSLNEVVTVEKADGTRLTCTFNGAEKNRVTLTPDAGQPYLEFGENVVIWSESRPPQRAKAQVWDNRSGRLILRTLPV
jgi:hypothetical protein